MDDERTTAQGLFLQADAYLDAARRLLNPISREGHAVMPIRFLLYHSAEIYLKSYLRNSGMTVVQIKKLGHRFVSIMDECISRGLSIAVDDYAVFESEQTHDQIFRSRYLVTGVQTHVGVWPLLTAVEGVRFDVRHHPSILSALIFRPWDQPQDIATRTHLLRWERLE